MSEKLNENMKNIEYTVGQFDDSIATLDINLNRVLKKHEYEYLQAYNIYVKNKERELVHTINLMNERNSSSQVKDQKIMILEG